MAKNKKKGLEKRLEQFKKAAKEGNVVIANAAYKNDDGNGSARLWINSKNMCFGVEWSAPGIGFGGFAIGMTDMQKEEFEGEGKTGRMKMLDSECMSRQFVKKILCQLVDEADWDHSEEKH